MKFDDSLDFDALCACPGNRCTHCTQEICQIDDLGFLGSAFDHRGSLGKNGRHHDVARSKDGRTVASTQIDAVPSQFLRFKEDVPPLDGDCRPEGLEPLQVEVDRTIPDYATSGK